MDQEQQQQFFAYMAQMGGGSTPGYNPLQAADMGIPGLGLGNMLFQPMMQALAAQQGMFPGQFFPQVNVADQLQASMAWRQLNEESLKNAQNIDVHNWLQTTAGAVRLAGGQYGLDQEAGFMQAYRNAAPVMSILSQVAPELIDQLHGSQGSAAVMTQGLFRGGQYRANMVTGIPGLRGDDMSELAKVIKEELYGTPDKVTEMQGIGMGQLGKIFDEAQRRGYMSSSLSVRPREDQLKELSKETGNTIEELEKLDDDDFGRKLRQFDSSRVAGRLKELSTSITAMRDLFGSMGQTNAPIGQLVNALEALTQNRLGSMSSTEVETIVRKTKALMETTGVSLDGLMGLTSLAANHGDQLGLDRTFAISAGQHAVGFAAAYSQAFGSDFTAFGALSKDQLAQQEAIRSQRASGSQQAQLAGAVVRTAEAFKLDNTTKAGRLADAIRRGDTTFEGKSMFEVLRTANLTEIMEQDNLPPEAMTAFIQASRDSWGNQEFIQKHDIGAMVRRLQPEELALMSASAGQNAVMSSLIAGGMDQEKARDLERDIGGNLLTKLLETSDPKKLSTLQGRQELIQKELAKTLGDDEAARYAPAIALSFEAQVNPILKQRGLGNLTQVLQTQNKTVLEQEATVQRIASADAEIDKALSTIGRAGPIARIVNLLQNKTTQSDSELGDLAGEALGGIKVAKIRDLVDATETIRNLQGKSKLTDADKESLELARERVRTSVQHINDEKKNGADVGRIIDDKAVEAILKSPAEVEKALAEADPETRLNASSKAVRMELARTSNFVQTLYMDEDSLRKLGPGGLEQVKSLEAKFTRMLRLTGNDTHMIAKALADDESIPEEKREEIKALHAQMQRETRTIGNTLTDNGQSNEGRYMRQLFKSAGGTIAEVVQALTDDPAMAAERRQEIRSLHEGMTPEAKALGNRLTNSGRAIAAKRAQLDQLTGGDPEKLKKALAGDASIPEDLRNQIRQVHGELQTDTKTLEKQVSGYGRSMTEAEFAPEKTRLENFRASRTATDDEQTKLMIDRLADIGGIDTGYMSDEDRKVIRENLDVFGSNKRKDLMLAIEARERLQVRAEQAGVTVGELKKQGQFADEFAQAGELGNFALDGHEGLAELHEALQGFAPKEPSRQQQEQRMRLEGTLDLRTGEVAGMGHTDMGAPK